MSHRCWLSCSDPSKGVVERRRHRLRLRGHRRRLQRRGRQTDDPAEGHHHGRRGFVRVATKVLYLMQMQPNRKLKWLNISFNSLAD